MRRNQERYRYYASRLHAAATEFVMLLTAVAIASALWNATMPPRGWSPIRPHISMAWVGFIGAILQPVKAIWARRRPTPTEAAR